MLAAIEDAAPASMDWGDIAKQALLDALNGLTGGRAVGAVAGKVGSVLGPAGNEAAAARAAAARAAADADQKKTIMVIGGVVAAVVAGTLLLRR